MASSPARLFLVDGYALIYRAFFAMISRPLRTSRGENTSAAWGVVNFLLRLRASRHPEYVAWVHDAGDSFRTARYPAYKSTRKKLDEELQADFDRAIDHVEALLAAFRIPVVAVPGYEADDVIGTLATRFAGADLQVVIVSGDKDFYQLIRPGVALLNPGRGGPAGVEELWVDESNAAERLGVPPEQVVDYLALVGDSSDNVPGVHGIGDKGARGLLGSYGSLEAILAHAEEVTAKRTREALQQHAANALLSRDLVTIQCEVPVDVSLETLAAQDPDPAALIQVLTDLEFHSLLRRLDLDESEPPAPVSLEPTGEAPSPAVVDDPDLLPGVVEQVRSHGRVTLETWSAPGDARSTRLLGLALGAGDQAWYLPFGHRPAEGDLAAPEPVPVLPPLADSRCASLRALLTDATVPKRGHDVKRDWEVLRSAGVELEGVRSDLLLESFLLEPGRRSHTLDTLALDHLGHTVPLRSDLTGKGRNEVPFAEVPPPRVAEAAALRLRAIHALGEMFAPGLREAELTPLLDEIELPLIPVLVDMEWTGIAIDAAVFRQLQRETKEDLDRLAASIAESAGAPFNLNSPKQLATVLFDTLGLPVIKRTKTGPSTDAEVLEQLADQHDVPRLLLEYRELEKLRSTYLDVLPSCVNRTTGRIHTTFNQTGAATGRLSSSDPNLQNIPIRTARGEAIRRGFVPAPGNLFVVADYSQIELRLMAHLSGDPAFTEAFRRGGDIHRETAAVIFGVETEGVTPEMRARAKTINFATIYGQGPFALARQLGISQEEAKAFISQYFERFAGVRAWLDGQVERGRTEGYVETLFKRRRYVPELKDRNFNVRAFGERLCQNSPLQGSAADLIKIAMIRIHAALRKSHLKSRLLLQVHDELVLEAPEGEADRVAAMVREKMESATVLDVPLVVDVGTGPNWLDAKG